MTTQCQKKFNRTNADKSTCSRSYAGRNRASKNSRKHGLTALPPWEDVTKGFRTILDDPDATPDPIEREDRLRAALKLADAEAQLERCYQTERAHLLRMTERARDDVGISFNDSLERALKKPLGIDALKLMVERLDDPFIIGGKK